MLGTATDRLTGWCKLMGAHAGVNVAAEEKFGRIKHLMDVGKEGLPSLRRCQ
jgi:hypothetical protein